MIPILRHFSLDISGINFVLEVLIGADIGVKLAVGSHNGRCYNYWTERPEPPIWVTGSLLRDKTELQFTLHLLFTLGEQHMHR